VGRSLRPQRQIGISTAAPRPSSRAARSRLWVWPPMRLATHPSSPTACWF